MDDEKRNQTMVENEAVFEREADEELTEDCVFVSDGKGGLMRLEVSDDDTDD